MMPPLPCLAHEGEEKSNQTRALSAAFEPRSLRTFTPTQAVISRSAGVYHWTADGRRLSDFTSGVLVANLGHNPTSWMQRFTAYMGWANLSVASDNGDAVGYFSALPMTTYNAVTQLEAEVSTRLAKVLQNQPGGARLEQVLWAASGAEAVQKAIWAAIGRDRSRPIMLATRHGYHGKKGLSNAVTGSEADAERDPRVRFISFPMAECGDVTLRETAFDPLPYRRELDALWHQYGMKIGTLITEPYLGGGGSYHPPRAYLRLLQQFCREHDIVFILDEVQSNFGRTRELFAFTAYGLEPDMVVLGKGLGNGVPVAAAAGRADLFAALDYGEGSDTWSANPLMCAAVAATLDEFESRDVLGPMRVVSRQLETGLCELKQFPFVAAVRGEREGMVWGVEFREHGGKTANERANQFVLEAYRGSGGGDGVHLLGPLAKKVVRIAPPLVITERQVADAVAVLHAAAERMNAS
jgi:4-aminobutyrate aminotransferase-like enzyme